MGRPMLMKAFLLALASVGAACAAPAAPQLRYRLEVPATLAAGAVLPLTFALENATRQSYWVLTWMTPLEGLRNDLFRIVCDGREIAYEGPMVKRGRPAADDFRKLDPGASLQATIDLAEGYALPAGSLCQIDFKGEILVLPPGARPNQTPLAGTLAMPAQGDAVVLRVK